MVLLLAGLIAPIVELFDTWDPEGLENDTEFGVFALIFVLCLALLVCRLISSAALKFSLMACGVLGDERREDGTATHSFFFVIPLYSPPLRI